MYFQTFGDFCVKCIVFDIEVDHKMVLITCKVKTGGAPGVTDERLITEGFNHPIGCFVGIWQNSI